MRASIAAVPAVVVAGVLLMRLRRRHQSPVNEAAEKGFFGIGIVAGKTAGNTGTLWRSAYQLGASFTFTIGARHAKFKREFIVLYHLT